MNSLHHSKFQSRERGRALPPQTIKDKFKTGALDSLDYSSLIFMAIQARVAQARNATPEFRHRAAGLVNNLAP